MKWMRFTATAILAGVFMCGAAQAQSYQYVGSFIVDSGPLWTTNPPVYSAQEAAALLFGGSASSYAISTNSSTTDPSTITHTGNYDGWGEPCSVFAESYKLDVAPAGYQFPGGLNTSWSAYVNDHNCAQVNYVWRVVPTAVPTLSEWAMIALSALLGLLGLGWMRRRQ